MENTMMSQLTWVTVVLISTMDSALNGLPHDNGYMDSL